MKDKGIRLKEKRFQPDVFRPFPHGKGSCGKGMGIKMISIKNLHKSFGAGESRTEVLKGITLDIADHDFMVLLGASGSGKSTLLNVISGLEPSDSGEIQYDGRDISGMKDKEITLFRKTTIGFVFQQYFLLPNLNVDKNVRMGADLAHNPEYRKLIEDVGLGNKIKKYPYELSGGEQQRVSIARALAKKPKVLYLDEPTGALDEATGRNVLDLLCRLQKEMGFTMVMVTHNQNYDAQCKSSKVVSIVSGGCLFLTTVVLLCFYIGHYIDTHQKQLGILKALGYARFRIAKHFWVFGLPVFAGTAFGYACAHALMPKLYEIQNKDGYLPNIVVSFHPGLLSALIFMPSLFFALLAVAYSFRKLKVPALRLIRGESVRKHVPAKKDTDRTFLQELEKSNVRQRKSLIFFITFAVFCFAAMTQMSFSMEELSSRMMGIMTMTIGIILAVVTLFIAVTSVVKANRQTITMMKVFGYQAGECSRAVLNGYRPWAYLGFALGTVYQYMLLKIMVLVVFKDVEGIPEYKFDVPVFFLSMIFFLILYETIMFAYAQKMKKTSIKEIMTD